MIFTSDNEMLKLLFIHASNILQSASIPFEKLREGNIQVSYLPTAKQASAYLALP